MARTRRRPRPTHAQTLSPVTTHCPACGHRLWVGYTNYRTVTTLDTVTRLTLRVRHCPDPDCPRYHRPFRPEAEPHFALPQHEFGLDVLAFVGRLRHAEHRSVPEIHRALTQRGVVVAERTVSNLLDRYDELRALATADPAAWDRCCVPRAGWCWPSTARNPTSATRSCGCCATASPARSCWPGVCCRRASPTCRPCWPRCATPCRCPSRESSPTARTACARRWPAPCRGCRISSATSTTCVRRPGPSTRPTATPKRS